MNIFSVKNASQKEDILREDPQTLKSVMQKRMVNKMANI